MKCSLFAWWHTFPNRPEGINQKTAHSGPKKPWEKTSSRFFLGGAAVDCECWWQPLKVSPFQIVKVVEAWPIIIEVPLFWGGNEVPKYNLILYTNTIQHAVIIQYTSWRFSWLENHQLDLNSSRRHPNWTNIPKWSGGRRECKLCTSAENWHIPWKICWFGRCLPFLLKWGFFRIF